MRFSRFTQRLHAHDWMAALIELFIVIVGILIALQVSNWNQDRIDAARGQRYTQRIHDDVQADIQNMAKARAFWKMVAGFGKQALAHGEHGTLVDGSPWKTVLAYYQAGQILPFELDDTTFNELRDAGDLGLIEDEDLRRGLSSYYRATGAGVTAQILRHDPAYRVQIRSIVPAEVQDYIWAMCFRQLQGVDQELIDCPSPISDAQANTLLAGLRDNQTLQQNLRYWYVWLGVSDKVLDSTDAAAQALSAKTLLSTQR